MRRRVAAIVVLGVALAGAPADAEPRTYRLDPEHLSVAFLVEHVGFAKVLGVFREAKGTVVFDEAAPELLGVDVSVATESVDSRHRARDNHLRSADFLDVRNHPEMRFRMTEITRTGERAGTLAGELTLLGQTRPLRLEVVWNKAGAYPFGDRHYALGISARGQLLRSDWGMSYGIADGLVGEKVEILIEAELIRED